MAGSHVLVLDVPGYEPVREVVTVEAGVAVHWQPALRPRLMSAPPPPPFVLDTGRIKTLVPPPPPEAYAVYNRPDKIPLHSASLVTLRVRVDGTTSNRRQDSVELQTLAKKVSNVNDEQVAFTRLSISIGDTLEAVLASATQAAFDVVEFNPFVGPQAVTEQTASEWRWMVTPRLCAHQLTSRLSIRCDPQFLTLYLRRWRDSLSKRVILSDTVPITATVSQAISGLGPAKAPLPWAIASMSLVGALAIIAWRRWRPAVSRGGAVLGVESYGANLGVDRDYTPDVPTAVRSTILFVAADPTDVTRLRIGEEVREIREQLQLSKQRDSFDLAERHSVRIPDFTQAILETKPRYVHFSGHGSGPGGLCFEDELGESKLVGAEALAALFELVSDQVDCVVLNACYSEEQATAIARHIKYVVGMNKRIGDRAAIAFAVGFYQALGASKSISDAHRFGCVQIRLHGIPEHLTPVLVSKGKS